MIRYILLLCVAMFASCNCLVNEEVSVKVHKDSLKTITGVHILSYPDEPLVRLLQDVSNRSVCYSYIEKEGSDSLILLPSCGEFLGVSHDDGLIIMDSYYYDDNGRHGVVQGYTFDGEKVCEMKTKIKEK